MQIALGLVAAEMGVCLVPYAASRHRADLQYRMIDDEHATSPVILSHRRNDDSPYLALIKALLQEMYAGAPVWLDSGKASDDRSEEHTSELQSLMRISYAVLCLK